MWVKQIKASDIRLVQTCEAFPEQYDAYAPDGNIVGYLRLRWGYFTVYCPDCEGAEVYCDESVNGWGYFFSNKERKKGLRKAKAVIAAWCNKNPGVYGDLSDDPHHAPVS